MAEPILGIPLMLVNRAEQVFPMLTEAQVARIAVHGRKRPVQPGEVLLDLGDQLRFFVVTKGKIDILSVSGSSESLIVTLTPGQFPGDVEGLAVAHPHPVINELTVECLRHEVLADALDFPRSRTAPRQD